MSVPAQRDPRGRLLPGFTGNAGGRPKGAGEIRELARQYVPAALTKIGELVGSADPRVALAAAQEVLNRVYGKPLQSVESEVRTLDMGMLYLAAVQAANAKPSAAIDITPPAGEPAANETNHADDAW
jgi:hypothetical protein